MAKDDIYQVTTTFVITLDDRDVEYHVGELVEDDDPALKRVPEYFGPLVFKHRKAKPEKAKPEKPRQATASEEAAIAATVEAEAEAEAEEAEGGKAMTVDAMKGRN